MVASGLTTAAATWIQVDCLYVLLNKVQKSTMSPAL